MTTRWDAPPPTGQGAKPNKRPDIPGLDPFLVWAEHTQWRGMKGRAGWDRAGITANWVQIIGRVDEGKTVADLLDKKFGGLLEIPPAYIKNVPGTRQTARHFTAWVLREQVEVLRSTALPAVWELSQPRRDAERVARASDIGRFGPQRNPLDVAAPNLLADAVAAADGSQTPDKLSDVIAVIDFGCPFLNTRFAPWQGVARTRVARLWDQGGAPLDSGDWRAARGWPWTTPAELNYGREIHPERLQAMVERVHTATGRQPEIDEAQAYRGIDYLIDYDDARRRIAYASHGGHVLDVAGGTLDPLTGRGDLASETALVFVQLPSMTAADSSGASLASHLLDAVRYVLAQCQDDARVVVNISYGSYAGPHDGHSLIETALDELLDLRRDNFAIVLAAGNARQKRCHARRTVRHDRSALLRVAVSEGDTTDTFVEVWYPKPVPAGWSLKARVRGPSLEWSRPVGAGEEVLQNDLSSSSEVVAMLRHEANPPNGKDLGLVLLALAPTAAPADLPCALAEAGDWEIELLLEPAEAKRREAQPVVAVHAWIERDDPGPDTGAVPHAFVDQDADDDLDTLSSLATGQHTVVAGGFRRSDRQPASYSSVGPQRDQGHALPLLLAACEEDEVHPDIAAAAVRSSEAWRMNGTSVAAPVLARRLFNAMAERRAKGLDVRRADWPAVLQQLVVPDGDVRLPQAD